MSFHTSLGGLQKKHGFFHTFLSSNFLASKKHPFPHFLKSVDLGLTPIPPSVEKIHTFYFLKASLT